MAEKMADNLDNNKKDRRQYYKDYAQKNKEKLQEQFICEDCGGKYKKVNKANHSQTKKHQNSLLIKKLKNDNENMKKIFSDINRKYII
jgi:isopropylmalate/homocitrate/citramalate synthase